MRKQLQAYNAAYQALLKPLTSLNVVNRDFVVHDLTYCPWTAYVRQQLADHDYPEVSSYWSSVTNTVYALESDEPLYPFIAGQPNPIYFDFSDQLEHVYGNNIKYIVYAPDFVYIVSVAQKDSAYHAYYNDYDVLIFDRDLRVSSNDFWVGLAALAD